MVTFVQGDAFAFGPQDWKGLVPNSTSTTWMVSDLIAYPDRVLKLLDTWCGGRWASHMIVTMKFQQNVDWKSLNQAREMTRKHGYHCRAKHFFNNKNEVTLMIQDTKLGNIESGNGVNVAKDVAVPMYKVVS